MNKLKIFLSYHKNTPIYKSDIFEPIQVGAETSDLKLDILTDNTKDNISHLNNYYCELTGQYWVLKNYIDNSDDDYIGFGHYRRLMDIEKISDIESPSFWGLTKSEADLFFKDTLNKDLYEYCKNYDIILPSKVYMYKDTVNPILRENENLTMYEHFKAEHNNNLMDELEKIIKEYYPEYHKSLIECFKAEKAFFYNIYTMKREILKKYLSWEFDILEKLGNNLGGWANTKYYRMAGFVGEQLINIWLNYNSKYKLGFAPVYMIDFEAEYIHNTNNYLAEGNFEAAINELKELLNYTSNKFDILSTIYEIYLKTNNSASGEEYFLKSSENAFNAENFYNLASITQRYTDNQERIIDLYKKSIEIEPESKFYLQCLLNYSEKIHDLNLTYFTWEKLKNLDLNKAEEEKYNHFMKIYKMINA